jgi:hypothetical protein
MVCINWLIFNVSPSTEQDKCEPILECTLADSTLQSHKERLQDKLNLYGLSVNDDYLTGCLNITSGYKSYIVVVEPSYLHAEDRLNEFKSLPESIRGQYIDFYKKLGVNCSLQDGAYELAFQWIKIGNSAFVVSHLYKLDQSRSDLQSVYSNPISLMWSVQGSNELQAIIGNGRDESNLHENGLLTEISNRLTHFVTNLPNPF